MIWLVKAFGYKQSFVTKELSAVCPKAFWATSLKKAFIFNKCVCKGGLLHSICIDSKVDAMDWSEGQNLWHVYEVFSIFWFLQTSARASGRNIEKLLMACHHTWRNYSVWDLKWQKLHIPVDQCDLHFIVLWFGAISWRLFSEFASLLKDKICVRIQITPIILNSKVPDRSVRVTSSTSYANSDIMKGKS